jgi:hypothetical protein
MDITAPQGMLAFQQEFPALDMREILAGRPAFLEVL